MTVQQRFDREMERRKLTRVKPSTTQEVRRLLRFPETALEIIYERLLLGCAVLDERETDNRWALWEMLLCAYCICRDEMDRRRAESEQAEIWALNNDPERREMKRRLTALNARSTRDYLAYDEAKQTGGEQAPLEMQEPKTQSVTGPMKVTGRTNPKWQPK